ncbi:hypothetical protein DRJ25_03870 [Candidatus Woesearchaeota archaeon]|nr:MAG: hypothetical protein DRJ25_03870 [Candidatus Woesearchaeota archaeon]
MSKRSKSHKKANICKTFFKMLRSPQKAFKEIDLEKGIGTALVLLLVSVLLGRILMFLIGMFSYRDILPIYLKEYQYANSAMIAGAQIIGVFLISLFMHLWLKLFRIRLKPAALFRIISFSAVPFIILGSVIFFKNWIFYLTAFFVIYGIKELGETTGLRSALSVMTAYFIFWLGQIIYGVIVMKIMMVM